MKIAPTTQAYSELLSESSTELPVMDVSGNGFTPHVVNTLKDLYIPYPLCESLVLKYLKVRGVAWGREISFQLKLSYKVVGEILKQMKEDNLIAYKNSSGLHDYQFQLTGIGNERALQEYQLSTYYGSMPVSFSQYTRSVKAQSLDHLTPSVSSLKNALGDITLSERTFSQLGQAIYSSKALFLYGFPGNGKTTIAQRLCTAFGESIWIPRSLLIHDQIVRLFDPSMHEEIASSGLRDVDERWVHIKRPTVVAGGELVMNDLEMSLIPGTGIVEAPLQMKSNCGVLLIDDFGRQRMSTSELLNRWIMPMETRNDYLSMPNGNRICVPFDQMLIFSTNIKPQALVDEAFLRRIPYKIHISDPTPQQFYDVFRKLSNELGLECTRENVEYLFTKHYLPQKRALRFCHPRDLLSQLKNYFQFHHLPMKITSEAIDIVVDNYFVNHDE